MRPVGRAAVLTAASAFLASQSHSRSSAWGTIRTPCRTGRRSSSASCRALTELLPISSSGHLILVPWLADWDYLKEHDDFNQTFDVALHLGTLVAVVVYFREDIVRLAVAWCRTLPRRASRRRTNGLPGSSRGNGAGSARRRARRGRDRGALGEPWQIAILLAVFGALLWIADRRPEEKQMGDLRFASAIAVGLAQCLALMPGVSRSGITITAGRFLGLDRDSAARFSFLLLVPIMFGAVLYKGVGDVLLADLPPGMVGPFVVGTLAAGATGLRGDPCSSVTSAATTTRSSSSTGSPSQPRCCC